jgi:hypothetical protein
MGQRLIFIIKNKLFMIIVKEREIYYNDENVKVQMLYPNPSPKAIQMGGKPTKEEIEEYNMCKNEEEAVSFIIRDCLSKGARLIKQEKEI